MHWACIPATLYSNITTGIEVGGLLLHLAPEQPPRTDM